MSAERAESREAGATEVAASERIAPWVWGLGWVAYASITVGSLLVAGEPSLGKALLAGGLNALPEAIAAPFVLRGLERRIARRGRGGRGPTFGGRRALGTLGILGLGALFTAWAIAASALAPALYDPARFAARPLREAAAVWIWRGAMALLIFGALAALAAARVRAREARSAALRAERAERLRATAELSALRSHLNPHFVLNVLHSLAGLATRDPERAAEGLERLGHVLRFGLTVHAEGRDLVPLREEVELTRQVLAIERMRLGERLRVRWIVDDSALDLEVPPFSLQPLVENAIRHAVAPRAEGGSIEVEIARGDGVIRCVVSDDGAPTAAAKGESGLGLSLLADRLRWLYGARARLATARLAPAGFRAELSIDLDAGDE